MTKPRVTLAGLRKHIDEGLIELSNQVQGPHSDEYWAMFDRYLKEPDNHLDGLFEKAGLDKNNVKHLQAVLWLVAAPLYMGKDPEWTHVNNVDLLLRATLTRNVLEYAKQPRDIRDVCRVLVNPRHLGGFNRDAVRRVLKEFDIQNEFWTTDYQDMDPVALETRLHETLSDYALFMRSEVRDRCSAAEIEQVEKALDCFRPDWRKG